MGQTKDRIVRLIEQAAATKVAKLAHEYVSSPPSDKEAIQAGIEVERWLGESCRDCLDR
jgi:hypothetical protein